MPAQIPDVHDGSRQFDMSHALAAHAVVGDFDAAAVADDALELGTALLVLAAGALVAFGRPEDALAEKAVAFGTQRAVVDRFGLFDFAMGQFPDLVGSGQAQTDSDDFFIHKENHSISIQ